MNPKDNKKSKSWRDLRDEGLKKETYNPAPFLSKSDMQLPNKIKNPEKLSYFPLSFLGPKKDPREKGEYIENPLANDPYLNLKVENDYIPDINVVSQLYEEVTQKPWSTAKTEGLTDGSFTGNVNLYKRLKSGEFGYSKKTEYPSIYSQEYIDKNEQKIKSKEYLDYQTAFIQQQPQEKRILYHQAFNVGENEPFTVVDKKNAKIKVYENPFTQPIVKDIDLGGMQDNPNWSPSDEMTVTKIIDRNNDGKITSADKPYKADWSKGNKQTGAGVYKVGAKSSTGYGGKPSINLTTDKMYEQYADAKNKYDNQKSIYGMGLGKEPTLNMIPTSMHKGYVADDKSRVSNGCLRLDDCTLEDTYKIMNRFDNVYILPETNNDELQYKNQKIQYWPSEKKETYVSRSGEEFKTHGYNETYKQLGYKPIKTSFEENKSANANVVSYLYSKSLEENKERIMKDVRIGNDTYNDIAEIAYGILGVESGFGQLKIGGMYKQTLKYFDKGFGGADYIDEYAMTPDSRKDRTSLGLTQIRWEGGTITKEEKELLKKYGITSNVDFMDPEKAALGTTLLLAYRYKYQIKNKEALKQLLPLTWNPKPNYSKRVNEAAKKLKIYNK